MKLYKKLLPCIVAVAVVLICAFALPTEAKAAEVASGTCGDNLTWVLDNTGTLTISGTGAMTDYNYLSSEQAPWSVYKNTLKKAIVTDGVTTIGDFAFYSCKNLASIEISTTVTSIGWSAFQQCNSLSHVTIPDSVTFLGYGVFYCSGIESVVLSNNLTSLNSDLLSGCVKLKQIEIPSGVTTIGLQAFFASTELESVVISDTVTSIETWAFKNTPNLTKVTILSDVIVEKLTHSDSCSELILNATTLEIKESITNIPQYILDNYTYAGMTAYKGTACAVYKKLDHAHNYTADWKTDTNNHWHECSICGDKKDLDTHVYTNACDTDCNICGYTRSVTHSYKTDWSKDSANHWHECSICGDKKDLSSHTPGAAATETTAQTCTTCGYVIKVALGHTHNFATTWSKDNNGHWHACAGCGEKDSYADHTWNGNSCSVCGANNPNATQPTDPTEPSTEPSTNPTEPSTTPTEPSEPSTQPSEPSTPTTPGTEPSSGATEPSVAPTEPQEPTQQDKDGNNIWIILLIIGIVCVAGGLAAVVVISKKRK